MDVWRRKREIMRRYDRTALIYDSRYVEEQRAKIETALNNLKINETDFILDVGCGTGLLFSYVVDRAELVVGLDISHSMLTEAKKHAAEFSNVALIQADADFVPLRDDVFNIAFAVTLLQNMPTPLKTLKEIGRVNKDNSIVIVTQLKKEQTSGAFNALLKEAKMRVLNVREDSRKKEYVAMCKRA